MNNIYKPIFSYIIPFRYSPDRIMSLRKVIDWVSGYQGAEIIVVEQDRTSKLSDLTIKANLIFTKSDHPFNKAWALNVGLIRAKSDTIIFGDADFIMDPMQLIESLKETEKFECILPTLKNIQMTPHESGGDLKSIISIDRHGSKNSIVDGISIFKRDAIVKIGGWNEDFFGGSIHMGKFQEIKIKLFLNYKEMNFRGFHFHHQITQINYDLMNRNSSILEFYKGSDSEKMLPHIQNTLPKIGQKNKLVI